jgi:hypothetical protein
MTSVGTVVSYPIPAYCIDLPIQAFYQPGFFTITAVSLGQTTTITTSVNHNYVVGQLVRLDIPPGFGVRQLNQQTGYVINIPAANQVVLNIVSTNADPFQTSTQITKPLIVAIGDVNSGATNANGRANVNTAIPGSFINTGV